MGVRRGLSALLLAAALSGAGPAAAPAQVGETSPARMIRSVEFVQDAIVNGDHAAIEMQRHLLQLFDERIRGADRRVFDDQANVDALLIYSMSGGNPETLGTVVGRDQEQQFDDALVAVVDAYLRGGAHRVLDDLLAMLPDHRDRRIEPYLTLVAANAAAGTRPDVALGLFDRARLLAPGTIIEESALRRSIFLTSRGGEVERGLSYANRYARRFLHSPYAGQFADLFVGLVLQHPDAIEAGDIVAILEFMDTDRRRSVYLRIARQAAINGDTALTALAAAEARAADENGRAEALAGLYAGVADVSSEGILEALDRIEAIDEATLSPRDKALRAAARRIGDAVVTRPERAMPDDADALQSPFPSVAGLDDRPFIEPPAADAVQVSAGPDGQGAAGIQDDRDAAAEAFVGARRALLHSVDQLLEDVR